MENKNVHHIHIKRLWNILLKKKIYINNELKKKKV